MSKIDSKKYPFCALGHQYALDIVSKEITANIYVIGACNRYLEHYRIWSEAPVLAKYYFDLEKAEKYLRIVQKFEHVIGDWTPKNIKYEPWQCFTFLNIIGIYNRETGYRKYRIAHVEVSRGNGKSLLASQAGLYFLAFDSPLGNKVACVASRKEQARIVLDSSRAMAKKSDAYRKKTGVTVLAHKIVNDSTFSEMRALSADSDGLDGLNDVLAILDELHVMKKAVFDVIYSGMSKRKDSLTLCITTAGFDMESVGYSQSVYAKKVATGEYEDEQFFSLPYTLDKDDDIYDPSVWIKSNPNYGVSVDPLTFEAKAKKAKLTPSDVGNFKVKHLNIWLSEANAFFNMSKWDKCADPNLKQEDYLGLNGYVGLDLASKIDLTGLVSMVEKDGIYYIFDKAYIPEERVKELNMPLYTDSVGDGFLTATPGEVINYPKLQEDFKELCFKKLKVREAFYDPWNATEFSQRMLAERINMVEFRMNTANLSEPMKWLGAKIIEGKVRHNGSPLLRWCMSNVVAKVDGNDNVYPRKSHEKLKIDLAIALIMASAGYMQESQKKSVYATRGIRVL